MRHSGGVVSTFRKSWWIPTIEIHSPRKGYEGRNPLTVLLVLWVWVLGPVLCVCMYVCQRQALQSMSSTLPIIARCLHTHGLMCFRFPYHPSFCSVDPPGPCGGGKFAGQTTQAQVQQARNRCLRPVEPKSR